MEKNGLICFILLWIVSACSAALSCDMQIPHGDVTWWCDTPWCSYSCHEGYKKHDTVSWLECSKSGRWVSWFWNLPVSDKDLCTPKPCPTVIPKGALSGACQAVVGSTCSFSCESGYMRNMSVSELTCQTSTEWSSDLRSLCLRTDGQQCPYYIPRGYLNLTCIREPGQTCNFTCDEGYQPSISPSMIVCGSDLQWNHNPESLCQETICPKLFEGGYVSESCSRKYKATCYDFQCDPGYIKRATAYFMKCDESGKWINPYDASTACVNETLSTVPRNEISTVGIVVGCVIGTILVTVSVGLIIQWSSLRTSHKRRIFGHENSTCTGPTGNPKRKVTSTARNHNTNNTGVAAPRIDMISSKYSGRPHSYCQIQDTSKEYPPTYEQVVANPSVFN